MDVSWSDGGGATSYDVYFGTDSSPDSGELRGNQAGTSFDPGTLAYSTTYYWRIDAVNTAGTTTGDVWSFTTAVAPPTCSATLFGPVSGATLIAPPTFTWSFTGSCSNKVYITTNPVPELIVLLTLFFGNEHPDSEAGEHRAVNWTSAPVLLDVGDADACKLIRLYAPWQPFSVLWKQLAGMTISNGVFRFVLNGAVGDRYVVSRHRTS